jgi:hypothetical protein
VICLLRTYHEVPYIRIFLTPFLPPSFGQIGHEDRFSPVQHSAQLQFYFKRERTVHHAFVVIRIAILSFEKGPGVELSGGSELLQGAEYLREERLCLGPFRLTGTVNTQETGVKARPNGVYSSPTKNAHPPSPVLAHQFSHRAPRAQALEGSFDISKD